ncbi:MAG: glycoside hydrolase family 10 protein, partial [Prochlorotrichaceae cyanobacterium]
TSQSTSPVLPKVATNLTPSANSASRQAPNSTSTQTSTQTSVPTPSLNVPRSAQPVGNPSIALASQSPRPNSATTSPSLSPSLSARQPAFPANFDPTQDVAPPGLEVGDGDEPIVFLEAVAMRKELSNLLGRFRSASLSVNVAETLDAAPPVPSTPRLTKSLPEVGFPAPVSFPTQERLATVPPQMALVESVQKILRNFPDTVASQNYALARQEWLQARDTLWQNYPDSQPLQPEIRAVWLDRGTIVNAGSPAGLKVLFDRLAEAGINVIFFETVNAGYPIYPSEVAPVQNPLTQGWDPLAAAIELAHDRQMELHAWIWTFAAGNRAHNRLVGQPADYLGPVLSQHPEWLNRNNRDEIWSAGKPFLDPANPAARAYVQSLITEISDRYAVDGIQLDYIRYPFQDIAGGTTFGYGKAGRERFQQRTGVDPKTLTPQHPLWEAWQNFRIEQVDTFVAEVGQNLRRNHPEMKLSVAVFAFPTHERLAKLQQNWEAWAKRGDVDLVCLMAYAMDTNRFEQLTDQWLSNTDLGGTLVTAGIHLLSLPDSALVLDQVQFLRDHSTSGYVLFATQQFNEALQTRFRPLFPGQERSSSVLPHRSPLQAAHLRYLALQQEWDVLSGQQQIWISDENRVAWDAARQSLDRALAEAARMPSAQNLHHATLELDKFRAEFPRWFDRHQLQNSYQVRTWQHRLSVLTILLHYGERMLDQSRPIALGF